MFPGGLKLADTHADLETFLFERMRGYFADAGYTTHEIDAVLSMQPVAVTRFRCNWRHARLCGLPEAASLAAANKRVANILRQAGAKGEAGQTPT